MTTPATTDTVGTITLTDAANVALIRKARVNIGNGHLTFGFLSKVDPGLAADEYVTVPVGSATTAFAERASGAADPTVFDRYVQCLTSDADTVAAACAARKIPAKLHAFVASNRAFSFAYGHLGPESKVGTVAFNEDAITAMRTAHMFFADAAAMDPSIGTLAVWATSLNYYTSNHNTTGGKLPKSQVKVIRQVLSLDKGITDAQITDAVYLAGHAADKRLTLRSILDANLVKNLETPDGYGLCTIADSDQWAKLRTGKNMLPAGTALVGMLKVLLNEIGKAGFLGFSPCPEAIACLENNLKAISANTGAFHPGAQYLFGTGAVTLADIEDLKTYVGILGGYAQGAGKCASVTSAPHVAHLISERSDAQWVNLGKQVAKGIEMDVAKINAAMTAYGMKAGPAVADPTADATKFKADHDALVARVNATAI